MSSDEIPERRYPFFVAVGFGGDGGMTLSLANLAGQAVNSTEVPEVPRPRPIDGEALCVEALQDNSPLAGLPLVVRSQEDVDRLLALLPGHATQVTLVESAEEEAQSCMRTPSKRWVAGEETRSLGHQYVSLDEARNLSSRLFYCLSGLSIPQRLSVWSVRAADPATDDYWARRNSRSAHIEQ